MNKKLIMTAFIGTLAFSLNAEQVELKYPETPTTNQVDTFHGVEVQDPYRWMEDNNSETLKNWVQEQNKLTFGYLETIPEREKIKERLTQLWNYERFGIPTRQADRYFIYKNDGLQNQSVLYTMTSLEADLEELIDPNKLSQDGTVALSGISISEDARWLAYGLSASGSDWQEWRVRNIETREDTADHIRWVKFSSAVWRKDGSGFYYCRYDEPDADNQYQAATRIRRSISTSWARARKRIPCLSPADFAKLNFR
jgi:prolyl oligopeptidase